MHARYATLFGEILGHLYAPGYIGLSPSELRAVKACLGTQYERLRQGHDMEPKLSGSTGAASTGPQRWAKIVVIRIAIEFVRNLGTANFQ